MDRGVEVIWRAFELRPDPVPALDPAGDYLNKVWKSSVYPLAARLGMTMRLPPLQPRSRLAHEAAHWARSKGRFDEYHAAVFRAFFERGENIGEIDVLASLATALELDELSLRQALEVGEFTADVLADETDAQMLGVTGVPAFIVERKAARSGVQTRENLKLLIDCVRSQ